MLGDNEVGQHINLINIPGPQESNRDIIAVIGKYGMVSDMHKIKDDK